MAQTKFRGAQVSNAPAPRGILELMNKKANLMRFQFIGDLFDASVAELNKVLQVTTVPMVLAYFRPLNNPITDPAGKVQFKQDWDTLISTYKDNPLIEAFDILNEPQGTNTQVAAFMKEMHSFFRIRTQKKLCLTCRHSDPAQFSKTWHAGSDDRIWYEVHMYLPLSLTHQGILGRPYPKFYPTDTLTKDRLKQMLNSVRKFQLERHARIYVGEFGISSYAPADTRMRYMRDCISIFQEYGWNWTYHAWREADVWDIENTPAGTVVFNEWLKNL